MSSPLNDLALMLQNEGVGTLWTDLFWGPRPATPDRCLTIQTYPGDEPRLLDGHNQPVDERWAVSVIARAPYQPAAEELAASAFDAITFRHETLDSGRDYAWARATSMPAYLGLDENGRALVSFNVTLRRHA